MRRSELKELIAEGESTTLEFKRKFTSPEKIAKEIAAFANTKGGYLLIGVDDDKRIYGVKSDRYHSCESMFFNEPNASKLALYKLIQKLQLEGHTWLDIQMVTDVSGQFGGKYISKKKFLKRIGL